MIGDKIKSLRLKNEMTQKDLADKLFVTSQAVSRWENGEVEPSISTVSEMAKIFNVSIDTLVNDQEIEEEIVEEKVEAQEEPEKKVQNDGNLFDYMNKVKQEIKQEMPKQVLCICENCNASIYENDDIHRFDTENIVHHGRSSHTEKTSHLYCTKCYNKKLEDEKEEAKRAQEAKAAGLKSKRMHSLIWPSIAGLSSIIFGIIEWGNDSTVGLGGVVGGVMLFTFIACLILNNNFIGELWLNISSWSVKLPGVIFTLSLDGIIFLILVKILGAVLSALLSIFCIILATLVGMFLSVFVYPFALIKNLRGKED